MKFHAVNVSFIISLVIIIMLCKRVQMISYYYTTIQLFQPIHGRLIDVKYFIALYFLVQDYVYKSVSNI